jgi:hypothetical protein
MAFKSRLLAQVLIDRHTGKWIEATGGNRHLMPDFSGLHQNCSNNALLLYPDEYMSRSIWSARAPGRGSERTHRLKAYATKIKRARYIAPLPKGATRREASKKGKRPASGRLASLGKTNKC